MIRAIVWKEWRDQRAIALTILSFGALALGLTAQFVTATTGQNVMESGGARELMALAVAYLAGSVCGSMLLADDKEIGTIEFLDTLPCSRRSLWIGKATYGLCSTFVMCGIIDSLAFAFDCRDSRMTPRAYSLLIFMAGMHGFAWGIFGGALAKSTLGAVFQGAVGSCIVGIAVAIPFAIIQGPMRFGRNFSDSLYLYYAIWMLAGLILSAFVFTSIDRQRRSLVSLSTSVDNRSVPKPSRSWRPRLASLFWLSARQGFWVALGAWAAGLIFGAALVPPNTIPMLVWPPATLLLGVLAGVTTMSEEQTKSVARFWAEQRLPLGRMWLIKVVSHFAIATIAALVMFGVLLMVSPASPFRTRLLQHFELGLRANLGMFLWFGLVYGFVLGHLSGMLFRKTIVAGLFALISSVILAGFLVPSLIGGGMNRWQMWLPALLLLLTARVLLYPWATERITFRGPVLRACTGVSLALVSLVLGVAYRVYEIPHLPDRLAESGYVESLPAFDPTDSGRLTRAIASQYQKASEGALPLLPDVEVGVGANTPPSLDRSALHRAATSNWTAKSQSLKPWLNKVFAEDWPNRLIELDQKPQGMFEDPRELNHFSPSDDVRNLREMLFAVRVRGLQMQAEGDAEVYPRLLRGGLAAVRNARFRGTWRTPEAAMECEEVLLNGLMLWLENLEGRDELLDDVLATLIRHEREMQFATEDVFWAERVVLANSLQQIGNWLPAQLDRRQQVRLDARPPSEFEAELVAVAWNIPWERARRDRLLRWSMDPNRQINVNWLSGLHLKSGWRFERQQRLREIDRRGLALRRMSLVRIALHSFQVAHGQPAKRLDQLVPDFLPYLPRDPFSSEDFGYRLSEDEIIEFDSGLSSDGLPRLDLILSRLGPAFIHVENLATVLPRLGGGSSSTGPTPARAGPLGMPSATMVVPPVRRIVPSDTGVLWSSGVDGVNHGGKRSGVLGIGGASNVDWVVLIPPAKNVAPKP